MFKNNRELAKKLLPVMRDSGRMIADEKTTTDSFAAHIEEIMSLGYSGDIHTHFSKFMCGNFSLATGDRLKWILEVLLDWVVLDTARYLTTKRERPLMFELPYGELSEKEFVNSLSFKSPAFHLDARPYTEVARTLRALPSVGPGPMTVGKIISMEKYNNIFDKILLWRTYYKEPFHNYKYGLNVRSTNDYMEQYFAEKFGVCLLKDIYVNQRMLAQYFAKKENVNKLLKRYKQQQTESVLRAQEYEAHKKEMKDSLAKEKEERKKLAEEVRIRKLRSAQYGQKQKSISLETLDGKVHEESVVAAGNRAAWLCPCGAKTPLIGRTYGVLPKRESVVVCKHCKKHYYLHPVGEKPNKPPEKVVEVSPDYDFKN